MSGTITSCLMYLNFLTSRTEVGLDKYLQERQFHFDQELLDQCPDDVSLHGYYQTEKYFSNIADSIKEDFTFHDEVVENCKEVIEDMENPISLYVRRTDYVEKSQDHPPCSLDYYKEALTHFESLEDESEGRGGERQVIIFTDDIPV